MKRFFPVSQPSIGEQDIRYVTDAVTSGWVSSIGRYIEEFEHAFARFCGTRYALASSNGTTGLHLALLSLDVKAGDEVIIPDLTFVATANAVTYTGARPVPVDIDARTLCIDVDAMERAITPRTRAIMPVHLYGHPARMDAVMACARKHGIAVIEDAAEAHGAEFRGKRAGAIGDCGVFSFYGNKIITSGEGGMITTDRADIHARVKLLRDHAMSAERRYWHTHVGYNYRMTNLQAALGLAQLERIDAFIAKRRQVMDWYRKHLASTPAVRLNPASTDEVKNVFWMVCLEPEGMTEPLRERFMRSLRERGVDSRPYFYPVSELPMYERADTPVAHRMSRIGLNLPSYFDLREEDVAEICDVVGRTLGELRGA
ncbi:MAG: DegT/DnrJ/EryC1/StrS family aminotransferase [Steroidobacteraceae bacterium]